MTEKDYNSMLVGSVQLSLATSKIALDKAEDDEIKTFAGFEIVEGIALTNVLKDLGTTMPALDEEAKADFDDIEQCEAGAGFDEKYLKMQLKIHRVMRDLTEDYLGEAPTGNLDITESECKHVAIISLVIFQEHLGNLQRLHQLITGTETEQTTLA